MKNYQINKCKLLFLLIIICCFTINSKAQLLSAKDSTTDLELWTGLDFAKEINKNLDLSFAFQTRLRENISIIRSNFGQIGLSFPLLKNSKKLKVSTSIRLSRNENAIWTTRPIVDIAYGVFRSDFVDLSYRIRFQKDFKNIVSENYSNFIFFDDFYWRNRITLKYTNLKNLEPFIAVSLFKNIERQSITPDQFRIITGFSYKVNKKHDLKLSYIYREKFNIKNQEVNHIISAKFYFEIKDFKKKRKKGDTKEKEKKKEFEKEKKEKYLLEKGEKETKKQPRSKLLGPHRIEP